MPISRSSFLNADDSPDRLSIEALEDRMMLSSTVEIFAAGATGQENLELFIDGEFQQTFFEVGGDASTGSFQRLVFESDQTLTPGNIGIGFANDAFDASIGLDRNLFVDRIAVDGVTVQAEDPSTFSTGIYRDGLTGPGFLETDVLNINGVLTFADPASGGGGSGDRIEFDAIGTTGEEFVDIFVNGESVAFFGLENPGVTETFSFTSNDSNISIEDVRIEFVNDLFDASRGIDRNVQVFEFRVIDGETGQVETARTSDANVLNSGIFVDGVGITEGFAAGGFLAGNFNGNAFVEISDSAGGGGGSTGSGDRIEFDAFGSTGEEFVDIFVNGESVAFFGLENTGVTETFSFTSDDPNISIEDVRLEFVNDLFDPSRGIDRNVQIFEYRVIDGDTGQVTTARTSDSNVLNSGIFANGAITQGFGAGGFLAGDFFGGNAFVQISDSGVGGGLALSPDSGFQVNLDTDTTGPAIGPNDQVASFASIGRDILVVGSNGVPLTSFGGDGSVNLDDLLDFGEIAAQTGFESPLLNFTDLEFFDDGALLVTGRISDFAVFGPGVEVPLIAKLNPDGTLDSSFSQQGVLQGTLIDLGDFFSSGIDASIDSSGRVIVFGPRANDGAATDYIVSRLNTDGSIDTSFGNNGNVFIQGSSFNNAVAGPGPFVGFPEFLNVADSGAITFGFNFSTDTGGGFPVNSLAIGRLLADGSFDQGFGGGGFVVRTDFSGTVQSTPDDGLAIGSTVTNFTDESPLGLSAPTLLLLNSNGDVTTEIFLTTNTDLGDVAFDPDFEVDGFTNGLAVDPSGNIALRYARSFSPFSTLSDVLVTLSPSGEVLSETVLDTGAFLTLDTGTQLGASAEFIFDSNNRLVVAGDDLARFEFV